MSLSHPPRFHPLRIADVRRETADAVSIAFDVPASLQREYRFHPGQYLTLRQRIGGEELRRSYSICTAPDDGDLRIAVKRVEGGLFSEYANAELRAGASIDVMTPTGRFGLIPPAAQPQTYVAIAAGSGITPILSILRGRLAAEPGSDAFLFYGNRNSADVLFRDTLEDMKDRYLSRFSLFYVLSRERQDVPVLNGRLDAEKVRLLLRHIVPAGEVGHVFICGPAGMAEEIEPALTALGIAPACIHVERFVSALGGAPRARPPRAEATTAAVIATAGIIADGRRAEIPIHASETILEAALRAGLDLPYACKGGMCSTCRARVLEGGVAMDLNFALEPAEVQAGFALTCQARPTTPRVVVDYDQV